MHICSVHKNPESSGDWFVKCHWILVSQKVNGKIVMTEANYGPQNYKYES